MKSAKVSELKAKLSGYLSDVRRGETVTVCDRQTPIARLVPLDDRPDGFDVREPAESRALPDGLPIRLRKRVDVVALLREERDQR
ncbi:MAG: type II toxin-antitoxin system prevent-host-death family antitoxin [Vicinamibacterales bacterium]|mgnify:FL=1|jgi:prevent-host-death family protein|nr:type II toxin-antitoxin system prevent-host-death family antitoxin [Vicinamibacterales bacterium]MDP7478119.1 type II toxin-antitoxin system prevent-host-death family antitoxin [Vicinamibacterales bacterium]MDP7691117.1 type II toxin-antitoxin system prevent-host-death family antitoxin [Vicinamibacterales bacterium]HJN44090.1 type II toxin-antitoxin system prevent-host-death family antitoxin [Vicinamibacterales bacterium]|tara:strand:- start:469 stop:723 length:255 start_codon:yes stop_codon:yes gene_type:complete